MEPISTKNAMRRHPSTSLNKRAPSVLPIKVNSASSCSQVPISWDASQGKAPWTVMIALTDSIPFTFNVPQASGSNFAVNWDVPKLSTNTQALVAVADSTGDVSGVSSFFNLNAGSGSCAAIQVDLDFVWYPTNNKNTPGHCDDWGVSWQTDPKDSGVKGTVSFTFLPENGRPVTVNAGSGAQGAFKYTIPFPSGTRFLASANDEGSSGTGGVGDLYSVSNVGRSKSCVALSTVGNGLPKGSGTLAPASTASTSTQSSTKGSAKTSSHGAAASNTSGGNTPAVSANDAASDHKSNSAGTAVGATFGVLGALALLGILFWWLRKKHRAKQDEHDAWGGAASNGQAAANVSPWRYSASPYGAPQTNSRASAWLRRASGTAATGFRVLGRGANNNSQSDMGHGRSGSITTSAQPHMQQATYRNMSVPEDNYALSSIGGGNTPDNFPRSPSPTQSQKFGNGKIFHSTVPDTALFPPPGPRSYGYDEGGYGIARQQRPMQQQGWQHPSEAQSPFADPVRDGGAVTMDGYRGPVSEVRKGTSSFDSQSTPSVKSRNLLHGRKNGSSAGGSSSSGHARTADGLGSDYIPPVGPTKTSIHDPYTHMSQLWDPNSHGEIADRINQAGRGAGQNMPPAAAAGYHGGFTRTGPGVQRVNAPITSEVMMPEQGMQRFVKTGQRKPTTAEVIDEDREELPYL
ncbi:uncharacterized protein FA14DRAFT_54178 [Meira miltonrushii]|uniref:Mid2 domain-containing protein n=1 Tax=Meira miltonrushii TaxID=1280837 RepID=A0A316VLB8_9BASI|nr:uncharacterized protein FA14DRAFT_54178 [Meira miltonrushii]PWN36335.1 hypothetical protein FA14DRAFT_54178 [Meira miltonrushii]